MSALIAKLEAATGPDADLDGEIFAAVYGVEASWVSPYQHLKVWGYWKKDERGTTRCYPVPKITESIDAALTLLPAKDIALLDLTISWEPNDTNVHAAASVRWYPPHKSGDDWHAQTAGGRTPALAICIAALKARITP